MPTKKRKGNKGFFIFLLFIMLLLMGMSGFFAYYYLSGSKVISPLPLKLGGRLPTAASDQSEKELKRLLKQYNIMYTAVSSSHTEFMITLPSKQEIILSKKKNVETQISSLQVILPRLTMEGKQFRQLDLRYDKPVVTY